MIRRNTTYLKADTTVGEAITGKLILTLHLRFQDFLRTFSETHGNVFDTRLGTRPDGNCPRTGRRVTRSYPIMF